MNKCEFEEMLHIGKGRRKNGLLNLISYYLFLFFTLRDMEQKCVCMCVCVCVCVCERERERGRLSY